MKQNDVTQIMTAYVNTSIADKEKDLSKFYTSGKKNHLQLSQKKLIAAFCILAVLLVTSVAVVYILNSTSNDHLSLSDIRFTTVASFTAEIPNIASSADIIPCTVDRCLESTAGKTDIDIKAVMHPLIDCIKINISKLSCSGLSVGTLLDLKPIDYGIEHITAYYVQCSYTIDELKEYTTLSNKLSWNGYTIYYEVAQTSSGYSYRIFFQGTDVYCCTEVQTLSSVEMENLLEYIYS